MVRTVQQGDFNVLHFVTGQNAGLHGFFDALLDRTDEFLRNGPTLDGVFEHETNTNPAWLDGNLGMTVLTVTTRLLDMLTFAFRFPANCFFVGNLGLADISSDVELAHHA